MKKISLFLLALVSALFISAPVFAEGTPNFSANTHIQNVGWVGTVSDENHCMIIGTVGHNLRMEAIRLDTDDPNISIVYNAFVQDIGWQGDRDRGQIAGTEGQGRQIEAFTLRLNGPGSENYDIYYRAHVQNYGWLGWAMNGGQVGTTNHFFKCEALQILIAPKANYHAELSYVTPLVHASTRQESRFIYLVNKLRSSHGLNYVSGSDVLKRVCDLRVMELPRRTSHIRPGGNHYETIVKDAFPNYPYPGGGFVETFIEGRLTYSIPEPAFNCYSAYPHMIDVMLDPAAKWMSWSGIVSGNMAYSEAVFCGLDHVDFADY